MLKAWRNTVLRFGLISIPVSLSPAKSDRPAVGAHRYDANTRERVKQAWTTDGETIARDTVLLYDVPGADPLDVPTPEIEGEKEIVLEAFLDVADVDPLFYDAGYALFAPKGSGAALGVVADTLRESGRMLAGTARFTDRPRSVVIRWCDAAGGLVLHTLTFVSRVRFADMRDAAETLTPADDAAKAQALMLVEALPSEWAPADTDPLEGAIIAALHKAAPAGAVVPEAPTTDADILATLRGDIAAAAAAKGSTKGAGAGAAGAGRSAKPKGVKPKTKANA